MNDLRNYSKALKFFSISHRLSPTTEKQQLMDQCLNLQAQGSLPSSSRPSPPTTSDSNSSTNMYGNFGGRQAHNIYESLQAFFLRAKSCILCYEQKYIAESYKHMIRAVLALIIGVIVCKFVLKQSIRLGSLPGDFNYSSGGVQVFFPMTTCALISYLFPIVMNWYQSVHR